MPVGAFPVWKTCSQKSRFCFGPKTVVLRFFNVFGPRQDPDSPYSAVIPRFIATLMRGERPTIFGDGEQTRDFTYVSNVVAAVMLACRAPAAPGRVYNVAAGGGTTVNRIFEMLCDALGVRAEPVYTPPRPGEVLHSRADIGAARRDLGFAPRVTLEEGLVDLLSWVKEQTAVDRFTQVEKELAAKSLVV